jgi:hypothetical protein
MNANELRIGNLFIEKYSKKIIPVLELLRSGNIVFDFECFGVWQAEPIKLTSEWLLKFGFKQTNESEEVEWYRLNGFDIATHEENGDVYFVYQHMVLRHIINVHQLQNLYFALTGTELTYEKETK